LKERSTDIAVPIKAGIVKGILGKISLLLSVIKITIKAKINV
jgi:hypothetical protein